MHWRSVRDWGDALHRLPRTLGVRGALIACHALPCNTRGSGRRDDHDDELRPCREPPSIRGLEFPLGAERLQIRPKAGMALKATRETSSGAGLVRDRLPGPLDLGDEPSAQEARCPRTGGQPDRRGRDRRLPNRLRGLGQRSRQPRARRLDPRGVRGAEELGRIALSPRPGLHGCPKT